MLDAGLQSHYISWHVAYSTFRLYPASGQMIMLIRRGQIGDILTPSSRLDYRWRRRWRIRAELHTVRCELWWKADSPENGKLMRGGRRGSRGDSAWYLLGEGVRSERAKVDLGRAGDAGETGNEEICIIGCDWNSSSGRKRFEELWIKLSCSVLKSRLAPKWECSPPQTLFTNCFSRGRRITILNSPHHIKQLQCRAHNGRAECKEQSRLTSLET